MSQNPPTPVVDIEITEVAARLEAGAVLVDVREPNEFEAGHAIDAISHPLSTLGETHTQLPTDKTLVCICKMGGRSARAATALADAGYQVVNVTGGMMAWEHEGYPVVTDDHRTGAVI